MSPRERDLWHVVRLRRALRLGSESPDVRTVAEDLERSVGPTVPRAMSARLLGVSQTALDRWIAKGDIPAVLTPSDRRELPLDVLLELAEAVEACSGHNALARVLRERRRRAAELDVGQWERGVEGQSVGHRSAELRGLAYHRAVAARLDPATVAGARHRLRRWRTEDRIHPELASRWEALLAQPLEVIAQTITEDSERGAALRQSSPFAGTLSEPERQRVLAGVT